VPPFVLYWFRLLWHLALIPTISDVTLVFGSAPTNPNDYFPEHRLTFINSRARQFDKLSSLLMKTQDD